MSDEKNPDPQKQPDFVAGHGADVRKNPLRVAFVTRRTSAYVKDAAEPHVMTYPEVLFRAAVAAEIVAVFLVWLSLVWNAPLEQVADPMHTPNPAKAPWYFLGLQELLHYFPPVVAGVLIPTVVVIALIVIPYFNINIQAEGLWLRDKRRRMTIFGTVAGALCLLLAVFEVWVALAPTLLMVALMLVAARAAGPPASRSWLASKPLYFWIMTWFLIELIVLTGVGTFFPGPGLVLGLAMEELRVKNRIKSHPLWRMLFGNPVRAFGTISLVFLLSLAIAPAKDYFSEWRHYQNQYLKTIRGRAEAVSMERRFEPGIRQIWIPEQNVVDRCTTCHVAMKEPSLAGSAQPFRPHPWIPHTSAEFGCVTCHRGQGVATTVEEAHTSTLAWEQPILPARYIEASCGQCHLSALPGTPRLNLGRDLLAREGCARCHSITQPGLGRMPATDDPPSLTHLASKTSPEWIFAWVKDPQAYSPLATMPNFGLKDDDVRDVTAFLIAQSTPMAQASTPANGQAGKPAPPVSADASQAGASLYGQLFCASCHTIQNAAGMMVGGDIGPELTRVGTKLKPEWLHAWLRNPPALDPDTRMPHYRLDEQQIALLTGFLQAKTDSDLLANVHLPESTPPQAAHGRALVVEYGCASCHEINGVRKPENFAPDLSHIGSKAMAQIQAAPGVPPTLHDYVAAKIRTPRAFGPNVKMPRFKLADQQVDSLTTALLALTDRAQSQPSAFRVGVTAPSRYEPAGKAGQLINDVRCFTCHKINGRGGDMAPDLTWEGSSVERAWLEDFLKNPNTLRPALIRRMPKFNLTPDEIKTLSDYIMTVYQTPAFDRDSMPASFMPAQVEQGRQLFYSRYACQSCHIVDPAKDKGYIGPTLSQVGARLTRPWMFHWLKDPQSLRPGTMEPNQNISDADARALTSFLMSLKSAPRAAAPAGVKK